MVGEGVVVEGLEHDLGLLLEQVPVGLFVQHGRTEGLDLPGVIPTPKAEDDSSIGQTVGEGVVLGQSQGVPHGPDVEGAAELDVLGEMSQVHVLHQQVGQALVSLSLEVVLREPEGVIAEFVGGYGEVLGDVQRRGQVLVGEVPVVYRRCTVTHIVDIDVAGVQNAESLDHTLPPCRPLRDDPLYT